MNYSLVAGSLVTLSLFFLFLETRLGKPPVTIAKPFAVIYLSGVVFWLLLGIVMDQPALVLISMLQILFLSLYLAEGKRE